MSMRLPTTLPPSRRREPEPSIYVASGPRDPNPVILGPATIEHLKDYLPQIRATYWDAIVNGKYADPLVFVIHSSSDYAKANGLSRTPDFHFVGCKREGAIQMGLIKGPIGDPIKPPMYDILLATANRVERHIALNLGPSSVLDMIHSDPSKRAAIEAETPDVAALLRERPELIERPWLVNDGLSFNGA